MDQFAIDDLKRQSKKLRSILEEEELTQDVRQTLLEVADSIDANVQKAAHGGQDVGG